MFLVNRNKDFVPCRDCGRIPELRRIQHFKLGLHFWLRCPCGDVMHGKDRKGGMILLDSLDEAVAVWNTRNVKPANVLLALGLLNEIARNGGVPDGRWKRLAEGVLKDSVPE